jgi:signal transduction histidine kinase
MQEVRPLARTSADLEWLRRRRLTNACLLVIGLIAAAGVGTSVGLRLDEDRLVGSLFPAALLLTVGTWLIIAYMFSRARRMRVAGGMIVALVLATLGVAFYLLPSYLLILIPFATLPTSLAALLLSRRAIYLAAAATVLAMVGASAASQAFPPPAFGLVLPPASADLASGAGAIALFLLALVVAPLRGEIARLSELLRSGEQEQAQAAQARRDAEAARAAADERLSRQQQHLEVLMRHISDGAIAVNSAGKVTRANSTARELWSEIADGDLVGQGFDQVRAALCGPTAAAQYVDLIDLPMQAPDGEEHYTHVLLDQRERARLERLRGELLGLLADEMHNPLTSMVTALEMTLGQNLPDGADRVLVGARRSGQRLLDLVTTLLEINQIEQNPNTLRRNPTPLRPLLDAAIAQTAPLQHQGAVTVVVEYSGDGTVSVDGDRVRRAFVHLLEHAIRQSPPYSTVNVRTEGQSDALVVRISDQGPGLTPQQREALFDQHASSDERKAPALGLAFSKLVIETHGGRVMVESSGSQGSTYAFSLPLKKRSAE